MDEQLREKIADIIVEREDESPLDRADAILQIPELDPTPTRQRILIALGGLRDNMTPGQVKTVQWFAEQFPNSGPQA